MTTVYKGHAVGRSETTLSAAAHQMGKSEMVEEAVKSYMNMPIDQRFYFSWPLICKLACKAMLYGKSFEDMCVWALQQRARGERGIG